MEFEGHKIKKEYLLLGVLVLIFILVLTSSSAISLEESNLGIFKQNDEVQLFQSCDNCDYVNLSSVKLPNGTILIYNEEMSKSGTSFVYDFSNTDLTGDYKYEICGNKDGVLTCETIAFSVTYNGDQLTTSQGIISAIFLIITLFLFLFSVYITFQLPGGDEIDDNGKIINISNLKHLKKGSFLLSWGLLMGIFYLSSNIGYAYLPSLMFGKFMFAIYQVMMRLTLPLIVVMLIWIFVSIFQDNEMKKMIERGGNDFGDI